MTASQFAELVRGRRIATDRWMGFCPAHRDRSPSLSIRQGTKGTLVCCMAGCSTLAVMESLGLSMGHLFDGPPPPRAVLRLKAREDFIREQRARVRRRKHGAACNQLLRWERVRDELGAKLMRLPDGDPVDKEMTRLFHVACMRVVVLETEEARLRADGTDAGTARNEDGIPGAVGNAA